MLLSRGLIDSDGRMTAWELMAKNDICTLPVNPFVLSARNGILVLTYQQLAESTENTVEFYEKGYNATAFSYKANGRYYIAYNSTAHMSKAQLWKDVMHELSHILLNHPMDIDNPIDIDKEQAAKAELHANRLTRRILAPSIVLHMCNCGSPEEIAQLCCIPHEMAIQRFEHLQDLRRRNAFLITEYERNVLHMFEDFICSYWVTKNT